MTILCSFRVPGLPSPRLELLGLAELIIRRRTLFISRLFAFSTPHRSKKRFRIKLNPRHAGIRALKSLEGFGHVETAGTWDREFYEALRVFLEHDNDHREFSKSRSMNCSNAKQLYISCVCHLATFPLCVHWRVCEAEPETQRLRDSEAQRHVGKLEVHTCTVPVVH